MQFLRFQDLHLGPGHGRTATSGGVPLRPPLWGVRPHLCFLNCLRLSVIYTMQENGPANPTNLRTSKTRHCAAPPSQCSGVARNPVSCIPLLHPPTGVSCSINSKPFWFRTKDPSTDLCNLIFNVKLVLYSVCVFGSKIYLSFWGLQKMFCTGILNFIQLKQVTWNWVVRIRPCCIVNLSLISTALSFIHTHLGTQRSPYNSEKTCFINLQSFSLHFLSR